MDLAGSPYPRIWRHSVANTMLGLGLMAIGVWLAGSQGTPIGPVLVFIGVYFAATNAGRLIRVWGTRDRAQRQAEREFLLRLRGSTLPRHVFQLLLAVAEVDGKADSRELELVRRFLLERFVDPINAADLRSWRVDTIATEQVGIVALELRRLLSDAECETIFYWACLVAFADRTFHSGEHEVLQQISRGLGMDGHHARRIFHYAKARFLAGEGLGGKGPPRDHRADGSTRGDPRHSALRVLGLEPGTTPEQLRDRYRELVKKYHPDAHAHLGPVAAEEASKQFREVQQAYEFLNGAKK